MDHTPGGQDSEAKAELVHGVLVHAIGWLKGV